VTTAVVGKINGSDHENDPFAFTMIDRGGGPFVISLDGVVTVNRSLGFLDFEVVREYNITVMIKETNNSRGPLLSEIEVFTIDVIDVNEAPTFATFPTRFRRPSTSVCLTKISTTTAS
jgi:hypothetical protein